MMRIAPIACAIFMAPLLALAADATADFDKKIRTWDGFGVNYVETRHTRDYKVFPQDYGGFKYLAGVQREQVIDLVFGEDGLKPGIVKAFCDPFHEPVNDNDDPYTIDPAGFDHKTTTRWIRYFGTRGLAKTRSWGGDLTFLAGLYGPPAWMTKQRILRGRDLDPALTAELAEYIAAWAKYLRDEEGLPVKYVSPSNESENPGRWPEDGGDPVTHYSHDYNLLWPDHQVVEFLRQARRVLDRHGLKEVGLANGEPATWANFLKFTPKNGEATEYAARIREDALALRNLGLIASHGFQRRFEPRGVEMLRELRPELHAWTTSYTWGDMKLDILEESRQLIYTVGCNAAIPWAVVHYDQESDKLSPPGTVRVSSNANSPIKTNNGQIEITKAYYHFKQASRAGQPGMAVAAVTSSDPDIGLMAFASNGTRNPDALVVINLAKTAKPVTVTISGTRGNWTEAHVTTDPEFGDRNYEPFREFEHREGALTFNAPARSSITFAAGR